MCLELSFNFPLLTSLGICVFFCTIITPLETLLAKPREPLILEEKSAFNLDATVLDESRPQGSW